MIDPNWNASNMTIRQEIAARIMAGEYANASSRSDVTAALFARFAVEGADALILELNKEPT